MYGSGWYQNEDDECDFPADGQDEETLQQDRNRERAKILRDEYDSWLFGVGHDGYDFTAFILDRIEELESKS